MTKKIEIGAKSLKWKHSSKDGKEAWEASIFGGQIKYMIIQDMDREGIYSMYINQDYKGKCLYIYAAQNRLQEYFEDYFNELIRISEPYEE